MWNWSENQIKLILIRHGATESNKEHRYLGKTDEPLSEDGIDQLQKAKSQNVYPKVDYLFSSPMKRCLNTARILYPTKMPTIIPEWEEMDFGAFEGKNYIELQGDVGYQAWMDSNGTLPFPEGESQEAFSLRCGIGFQKMIEQLSQLMEKNSSEAKIVGMIVHGGTIMSLLSQYGGGEYFDYQVSNGSGYLCTLDGSSGEFKIVNIEKL